LFLYEFRDVHICKTGSGELAIDHIDHDYFLNIRWNRRLISIFLSF